MITLPEKLSLHISLGFLIRLCFYIAISTVLPIYASPLINSHNPLVEVHYHTEEQKQQLLSLTGAWEINASNLLLNPSQATLQTIQKLGYRTKIIYQHREDFLNSQQAKQHQSNQCHRTTTNDAGNYHTYAELKAELQQLQTDYPALAAVYDIGDSWEKTQGLADRDILALKISSNAGTTTKPHKILFLGGHHAREWISVEIPIYLARYLLENFSQDSQIQSYLAQGEIWIVPLVNPDGHQYSVEQDRWWRKNRRLNNDGSYGVDLNRNYAYQWSGPGSSNLPSADNYHGPNAFSEPESQAIRDLAQEHYFNAMISYHSYGEQVFFPWNYSESPPLESNLLEKLALNMGDLIKTVNGKNYQVIQAAYDYPASGTTDDWFYAQFASMSFTIELPPNGYPYFELPEEEIQPTFNENLAAALALIEWSQLDNPEPQIYSDNKRNVFSADTTTKLNISLKAGNRREIMADWWLYANTPLGQYFYNASTGAWQPGLKLSYQGKTLDIDPIEILNTNGLPLGNYVIYFGLESHADGKLDENIMFLKQFPFSLK